MRYKEMDLQLHGRAQHAPRNTRDHLVLKLHGLAWRLLPALRSLYCAEIGFTTTTTTTTAAAATAIFSIASTIASNSFDFII